jgi:hypothetical protein
MSAISSPNEPEMIRATILRRRDLATNRLASGFSLVKKPTRPGLTARGAFETFDTFDTLAGFVDLAILETFAGLAAFCSRLAEMGVTDAGAFGNPFAALFFAGPGRFNLVL